LSPFADLDRVVVVVGAGTAEWSPGGDLVKSGGNVGPAGQRIASRRAVALDVRAGAPAVGEPLPNPGVGDVEVVRQLEVDRTSRLDQGTRPSHHVGDVEAPDAIELDVVDAPGGELVGPGVDERLSARLGVVDPHHAVAVVVELGRGGGDVVGVIRRALNGRVLHDGLLRDARRDVEPELEAEVVHVVGECLDPVARTLGREMGRVDDPPPIAVHVRPLRTGALVPEVVEVHVLVADIRQAARHHRAGLRLDARRRRVLA
jgi:hypothetical protein